MSTLNIQFHDKMTKYPQIFVLLIYRKNFVGTQKRVRISHGKRAIGVRAIEVLLYCSNFYNHVTYRDHAVLDRPHIQDEVHHSSFGATVCNRTIVYKRQKFL